MTSFLRHKFVFSHKLMCCYGPQQWRVLLTNRINLAMIPVRPNNYFKSNSCRFLCTVVPGSGEKKQGQLDDDCDMFGKLKTPLENPRPLNSISDHVTTRTPKSRKIKYEKKPRTFQDNKLETYQEESRPNRSGFVTKGDREKGVVKEFNMSPSEENMDLPGDHDTFGNSVENDPRYKELLSSEIEREEDGDEKQPIDFKRKRYDDYAYDMRNFARSGRLKDALDLMDTLNNEIRLKHASSYLFCVLIGYCGRAGYTDRAFKLFKQMKDRGIKVTPGVLTGLFNSCAQSPYPEDGLEKAKHLYENMQTKGWHASTISYHAMIKAFGKLGDLETAFALVDEMKRKRHAITNETFSFLLMACISDKEAGFTHAVSVLRKLRDMKIAPSVYNYDLFLRATRDCGIGPPEVAAQLLLGWKATAAKFSKKSKHFPTSKQLKSGVLIEKGEIVNVNMKVLTTVNNAEEQSSVGLQVLSVEESLEKLKPRVESHAVDLLLPKPSTGQSLVGLSEVKWPSDRLALVGRMRGMMSKYKYADLKPSIKTFTILLGIIPPNRKAEDELLQELDAFNVKPDTDFFNVLIKKRSLRDDPIGARNTLDVVNKYGLRPDIATFGVLAMTCRTRDETRKFLRDMSDCGFRPNIEIYGALVHGACRNMDMKVVLDVMNCMRESEVKPDPKMLQELEQLKKEAKKMVLASQDGHPVPEQFQSHYFQDGYKKFSLYYNQWLKSVGVEMPQHPWKQYEENVG